MGAYLGVSVLIPALMLLFGWLFLRRPPRRINSIYGYRTARSMQNQETWEFAHRVGGRVWLRTGAVLLAGAAALCAGTVWAWQSGLTVTRYEIALPAGLEGLEPGQVQDIVVAGLSAETMIEVFEAAPWVFAPGMRLVLVPATRHEVLRRWLARRGFALAADIPVQCAGRWYAVIAADYTGKGREPEETWCQLGDTSRHPGGEGYKADRLIRWRKRLRGMPDEEERARQLAMIEQLEG